MFFITHQIRNSYHLKPEEVTLQRKNFMNINLPNTPSTLSYNFLTYNPQNLFVVVPKVTSS